MYEKGPSMNLLYVILGGGVLIAIMTGIIIWMRKRKHGCDDHSKSRRDDNITDCGSKVQTELEQGPQPCRTEQGNGDYLTVDMRDDSHTAWGLHALAELHSQQSRGQNRTKAEPFTAHKASTVQQDNDDYLNAPMENLDNHQSRSEVGLNINSMRKHDGPDSSIEHQDNNDYLNAHMENLDNHHRRSDVRLNINPMRKHDGTDSSTENQDNDDYLNAHMRN